jgi:NADPH:quinone reductase-like Zn-dependent oxidoreductase
MCNGRGFIVPDFQDSFVWSNPINGWKKIQLLSAKINVQDWEFIIKLVEGEKLKPIIDRRYPLHEVSDAIKYLKQGHAHGKVVISVL